MTAPANSEAAQCNQEGVNRDNGHMHPSLVEPRPLTVTSRPIVPPAGELLQVLYCLSQYNQSKLTGRILDSSYLKSVLLSQFNVHL